MQQALQHLQSISQDAQVSRAREPLLAAALIHDVGHGPFSHLFEPCLGIDHEEWSRAIILTEDSEVHKQLRKVDRTLPKTVADLIDKDNHDHPSWMKYLLSSQLDMDRLDYLRRDSLFTGAGYGHFDYFRILNTFELFGDEELERDIVWGEKSKLAIEEYIFSRYYMYQNVYLHKTTRGFEKMIEAMWRRARTFHNEGTDVALVPVVRDFWSSAKPTVEQYLRIEEFTVLQQIQQWKSHSDKAFSDLARRFLQRERFAVVDPPPAKNDLAPNFDAWERALLDLVKSRKEYDPPEMYCLKDQVKAKYNQPYFPEKETDEHEPQTGHGTELLFTGISVFAGLVGFVLAWLLYYHDPQLPQRIAAGLGGLYEAVVHKYYIDELYATLFVKPLIAGSALILWHGIDQDVIDASVDNGAQGANEVSDSIRHMQSGNLRSYAGWVAAGAAAVIAYMVWMGTR